MWTLLLVAGIAAGAYLVSLRVWPVKACGRCEGSGKLRSPSGRNWRTCTRCKGSGGRVRLGRRVLDGMGTTRRNL